MLSDEGDAGVRLLLDGHFSDAESEPATDGAPRPIGLFDDVPLLLGVTAGGKPVSLIDCHVVSSSGLPRFTKTFQVLRPEIVAYDVHFENIDRFRLTSLSGRYSNLDQWVDTFGFSYAHPSGALYPVSVTYAKPEEVKATLSSGLSIHVAFSVTGPNIGRNTEVSIRQEAWLSVRSTDERSYEELLGILTSVADLVSVGIGQATRLLDLRAGALDDESPKDQPKTIHFPLQLNSEPIAPYRKDIDAHDMLFTLSDIRANFGDVLEAWCIQQDKLKPLYSLYFGALRSAAMYVEHRFLNMFQALESFDRRDFVPAVEATGKHNQRIKRILDAVESKKDRNWLKSKLRYSHEPSATERLKRLVEKYQAAWLFENVANEIELAGNFRNFYTHYDPKLEDKLPPSTDQPKAMHNLAARFQTFCEVILLREVGFPADRIKERMQNTKRLQRRLAL